jgi:hypothetical protein
VVLTFDFHPHGPMTAISSNIPHDREPGMENPYENAVSTFSMLSMR